MTKLLPDRYTQADFFAADITNVGLKDDIHSMESPLFTLSKNTDTQSRLYEHNGNTVEIQPGIKGMPTQWDKDIILFLASQVTEGLNRKRSDAEKRVVQFRVYDYCLATNRKTSGREYEALRDGLERIDAQRIRTNVVTGGVRRIDSFGLINGWSIIEKSATDNKMIAVQVILSDWLHSALQAREVLTLHNDYFRLSSSLDRRLYELARKHCGKQASWSVSMAVLHKKSGSTDLLRRFRAAVKKTAESNPLPAYTLTVNIESDIVTFNNRTPQSALPDKFVEFLQEHAVQPRSRG